MTVIGVDIRVLGTGRISGIEEYTEQVVSHMIARSTGVQWKLYYSGRRPLVRRTWMDHPSVSVHELRRPNRMLWLSTWTFGKPELDRYVGGADAFFFPHFLLGALSSRCKRVMTWHDTSYEQMPYVLSAHRRFWHAFQMNPAKQIRTADRVVAVSGATASDVAQWYGVEPGKVTVVHSGVDPLLRRMSEPHIAQWRVSRDIQAPFVLALGTREPRKNIPAVIRAWSLACRERTLRDTHLVIVGQAGWNEGDIRRAIASSDAPQNVHLLDAVDRNERAVLLSAASVLVYPSLMEGFGFPPLEAMACGTPVITSASSSLFETVGQAGLLVDPYRIDDMADALRSVLLDAGLRSRLIARGYDQVGLFSWTRAAEKTLEAILGVLS